MKRSLVLKVAVFLAFFAVPVMAAAPSSKSAQPPIPVPKPRTVVTHASVTIGGQTIPYTTTTGTLLLYNKKHQATASVFYIAYTEDGAKNIADRPITFSYNGGPGFASALVDIGGFGPRRIIWPGVDDISAEQPPYQLVNNDYSVLKSTDLVFIDAVGTGYSRIVGYGKPKMFYGFTADGSAFSQFIQRYITRFGRWESPKFLLGESYGTTRNAVLARDLVAKGVYLDGVIMCSTVLDFPTINFTAGNDLPYALYLPSYAAVAWYHHKVNPRPASLSAFVEQARQFAAGPYVQALFAGDALSAAQKQQIAQKLSQFTGISTSLWLEANLRMTLPVFMRRLMGSAYLTTGRYDARFTSPELQPLLTRRGRTPAGATTTAIWGALTSSFDNYVSQTLGFKSSRLYVQSSGTVFRDWSWTYRSPLNGVGAGVGNLQSRNVAPSLSRAMNNDPGMQVMFNNGYYDMATPFYATEYTVAHMGLPASLQGNVHFYYYPVGHMLYVNPKALPTLARNIDSFIASATARNGKS